jgi:TPR repeat protein
MGSLTGNPDKKGVFRLVLIAAAVGNHAAAQYRIAGYYQKGFGFGGKKKVTAKMLDKCEKYNQMSADQGNKDAIRANRDF